MSKPSTSVVYSEAGGATKTTTAVSLAVALAESGRSVVLIDLDPRGATTKWLGVDPAEPGLHVGAILADASPDGWVNDLAVPSSWKRAGSLRVVPSNRQVSNREKSSEDHAELRLLQALQGVTADEVILDAPNRQGGPLIQNALNAADRVIYAGKLDEDGLDGVEGARTSVARFRESRRMLGASDTLSEAGIVVGAVRDTVMSRDSKRVQEIFASEYPDLLLMPMIPERVVVREARAAGDFYGWYPAGGIRRGRRFTRPTRTSRGRYGTDDGNLRTSGCPPQSQACSGRRNRPHGHRHDSSVSTARVTNPVTYRGEPGGNCCTATGLACPTTYAPIAAGGRCPRNTVVERGLRHPERPCRPRT